MPVTVTDTITVTDTDTDRDTYAGTVTRVRDSDTDRDTVTDTVTVTDTDIDTVSTLTMLGSGSAGNSALVATDHCKILIDGGLSARQLALRLEQCGVIAASFWLFTSLAWTQTVSPLAPSEAQAQRAPIPLQVSIPTPPSTFRADMQWHLCYEIYLTNLSSSSWMVQHIDVKNESGAPLLTLQTKELETVLSHPALPPDSKGGPAAEIAPGEAVIAYMWIDLVKGAPIPTRVQHKFSLKNSGER